MSVLSFPEVSVAQAAKVFFACLLAVVCSIILVPRLVEVSGESSLEDLVPRKFGEWTTLANPYAQVSLATGQDAQLNLPYDQTVTRTYVNRQGQHVMLALAWGKQQRQEVKIHRPDLCYVAQGYKVSSLIPVTFGALTSYAPVVKGKRMIVNSGRDVEAVSYWIRIGSLYSENAFETRTHIFFEGLAGRIPDGVLVRASQKIAHEKDAEQAFLILEQFLSELLAATPENARLLMVRG